MRCKSFCRYRPTLFKIALTPPLAETYIILFKLPDFPANNCDIIAMHFFQYSHFNEIIPDTFGPDTMHGLS